jgi:myo-inositol catabolism protein IolC
VNVDVAHPLYLLPFDHRTSFTKDLLGITGPPDGVQRHRVSDLKMLIWEGFTRALARGATSEFCGVLVDEEFGADVARAARSSGVALAMPVEKSGQDEFELAYGDGFAEYIDAFDPDFVKVLVRYNPEGEPSLNARQDIRLAQLSEWLVTHGRSLLFELLVPPTAAQTAKVGDGPRAYERNELPGLIVDAIAALQDAGVEPNIWKIQGIDARAGCEHAAAQARIAGRDRTIWRDPLADHIAGRTDREAARDRVAQNYLDMISTYQGAAGPAASNMPISVSKTNHDETARTAEGRGCRA